jgi:hypothetical protein
MPNAPSESSPADTAVLELSTSVARDVPLAATRVLGTRAQRHSRRRAFAVRLTWLPVRLAIALVLVLLMLALWRLLLPNLGTGPAAQLGSSAQITHAPATSARPVGPPAIAGQTGPADATDATSTPGSVTGPRPDRPAAAPEATRAATNGGSSATGEQHRRARRQGGKPPWAGSGRQKVRDNHGLP